MPEQREISDRIKRLFGDVKREDVDLELHYPYIISRVMDFGDEENGQWMLKTFSLKQIEEVIRKRKGLSKKSAIFLGCILRDFPGGNRMLENTPNPKIREVWKRISPLVNEEDFYLGRGTSLFHQINHRISDLPRG